MTEVKYAKRSAVACDGCGREYADGPEVARMHHAEAGGRELDYCPSCAANRKGDPQLTVAGRTMTLSEVERQAEEGEPEMAAAIGGDTVQDVLKAVRQANRKGRSE